MSVLNLTKKEKICLNLIAPSFIVLIISTIYICFFSEKIDLNYYSKLSYETKLNLIKYNTFAYIMAFLSFLTFVSFSQFLVSGSQKFFQPTKIDKIQIRKNYEISSLIRDSFLFLLLIIIATVLLNENIFNNIFSNNSLSYIENIINGKGVLENNIERAQFYLKLDSKANVIKAVNIVIFSYGFMTGIISIYVWLKYKKQGLD